MAKTRSQTRNQIQSKKTSTNLHYVSNGSKAIFVAKEFQIRINKLDISKLQHSLAETTPVSLSNRPQYNLRQRNNSDQAAIQKNEVKPMKSLNQIVAMSQAALYTARATRMWDQIKKQKENNFKLNVDDIVVGRMAGHRPWPCKIIGIQKIGIKLSFFGTHDIGVIKKAEIVPFVHCKEMIDEYLKVPISDLSTRTLNYHLSFVKATKEVSCIYV